MALLPTKLAEKGDQNTLFPLRLLLAFLDAKGNASLIPATELNKVDENVMRVAQLAYVRLVGWGVLYKFHKEHGTLPTSTAKNGSPSKYWEYARRQVKKNPDFSISLTGLERQMRVIDRRGFIDELRLGYTSERAIAGFIEALSALSGSTNWVEANTILKLIDDRKVQFRRTHQHYLQKMSVKSIAEEEQMPESTVRGQLHREKTEIVELVKTLDL